MKLYYENDLTRASLSVTNSTERAESIIHPFRGYNLQFNAQTAEITAQWMDGDFALVSALIVTDCAAQCITVSLENNGEYVYSDDLYPKLDGIAVLQFARPYTITKIVITFANMPSGNYTVGKLYVGGMIEFPRFVWGSVQDKLNIPSQATRTMNSQVYGVKKATYNSFSAKWTRINNTTRLLMQEYAHNVQTVVPHFIAPYDVDQFPPMYVVLNSVGSFVKRQEPGFYWDTDLAWEEAK
jgi:hypothetical protein